jgi:PEP-CTERM motif
VKLNQLLAGAALALCANAAHAVTYTYVGSWNVADGPDWHADPLAYTGQQAAALLFGGTPSEYAISTNGPDPSQINFDAIYSVFSCCQATLSEDYVYENADPSGNNFPSGLYFNGVFPYVYTDVYSSPASAYVYDNADGENYAFLVSGAAVPEPATWTMLIAGLGLIGFAARRRTAAVASAI